MENIRNSGYGYDPQNDPDSAENKRRFAAELYDRLKNELGIDLSKTAHAALLRKIERDVDVDLDDEMDGEERELYAESYALWNGSGSADVEIAPLDTAERDLATISERSDASRTEEMDNRTRQTDSYKQLVQTHEESLERIRAERDEEIAQLEMRIFGDAEARKAREENAVLLNADLDLVTAWIRDPESAELDKLRATIRNPIILKQYADIKADKSNPYRTNDMRNALRTLRDEMRALLGEDQYEFDLEREKITARYEDVLRETEKNFRHDEDMYLTQHRERPTAQVNAGREFSAEDVDMLNGLELYGAGMLFAVRPGCSVLDPENSFMIGISGDKSISITPLKDVKPPYDKEIKKLGEQGAVDAKKNEAREFYWQCRYFDVPVSAGVTPETLEEFNGHLPEGVRLNDVTSIRRFFVLKDDWLAPVTDGQDRDAINSVPLESGRERLEQHYNVTAIETQLNSGNPVFYANESGEVMRLTENENGQITAQNVRDIRKPSMNAFMSALRGLLQYVVPSYYENYDRRVREFKVVENVRRQVEESPAALSRLLSDKSPEETLDDLKKYRYVDAEELANARKADDPMSVRLSDGRTVREAAESLSNATAKAHSLVSAFNAPPTKTMWTTFSKDISETVTESVTKTTVEFEKLRSRMNAWAELHPNDRLTLSFDDAETIGKYVCLERAVRNPQQKTFALTSLANPDSRLFEEVKYTDAMLDKMTAGGFTAEEINKYFGDRPDKAAYTAFASALLKQTMDPATTSRALDASQTERMTDAERLRHVNASRQREAGRPAAENRQRPAEPVIGQDVPGMRNS